MDHMSQFVDPGGAQAGVSSPAVTAMLTAMPREQRGELEEREQVYIAIAVCFC